MDQNQIIQKIVEEVLARMGPAAATSQAAANAAAQSAALTGKATGSPAQGVGVSGGDSFLPSDLAKYIDHTLLKPDASVEQVDALCDEAAKYHFYSVCVNSSWVEHCVRRLGGTGVKTSTLR